MLPDFFPICFYCSRANRPGGSFAARRTREDELRLIPDHIVVCGRQRLLVAARLRRLTAAAFQAENAQAYSRRLF
jgi:hypothetical protein